jgi:hypothetical protein
VTTAKILVVAVGASIGPARLPCWPACLVLFPVLVIALFEVDFCGPICLEQSIFLRYLWITTSYDVFEN